MEKYEKFRWFCTSSNKLVLAGKNAGQNEELVKKAKKDDFVLHTKSPGSPFCIIDKKASSQDIKEAAVFCACFSQEWKKEKKEIYIHVFKGEQIKKEKTQKKGTFSVIGKIKEIKVKLELGLTTQPYIKEFSDEYRNDVIKIKHIGTLKAVPLETLKKQKIKPFIILKPGKIKKEDAAMKIHIILAEKYRNALPIEEIMRAIPAGGFSL